MKIIKARTSGFCIGVRKAVDTAYKISNTASAAETAKPFVSAGDASADPLAQTNSDQPVYMLGELIHNRQVTDDLAQRGLRRIETPEELPQGAKVIVRAHGIAPSIRYRLLQRRAEIIDCTCPFVRKIHDIVSEARAAGKGIIITGSPDHPEVVGINGAAGCEAIIIEQAAAAENMEFEQKPYVLVSQTTFSIAEFAQAQAVLQKKIANLQIFDTICITTERRQKEAREIARAVDLMFVIGSRNSSNTRKLLEVCLSEIGETYLIEKTDDVRAILTGKDLTNLTVGITAGASTPEQMIREVTLVMSEIDGMHEQDQNDFSFSDFIDNIPQLKRGATVKGIIVRYDNDNVYVDVRDKSEGKIPRHEFDGDPDFDLDEAIANHTEIDVYVRNIRNSDMGKEIILSKARVDFGKYKGLIEEAFNEKTPIQVKVVNIVKDGVIATYGGVDIYIHRTQLEMGTVTDLEPYKGETLDILVTQYDPDKKRLRVSGSRRALLNSLRKEKAEEVWKTIEVNKEYCGVVRSLTDFGAFVDIGGVDGLVHVSELSWKRIRHPSEIVNVGDEIDVYVKDFDPERKRISLGYKRLEDDPYHDVEERFPVGSIVHGTVVRMFPFGAFVEIAPGVDALNHISQISNYRLSKPGDVLHEGMEIDARVLEVSNEARRVSISIKEVEPIDPVQEDTGFEQYQDSYQDQDTSNDVIAYQDPAAESFEDAQDVTVMQESEANLEAEAEAITAETNETAAAETDESTVSAEAEEATEEDTEKDQE
ncbi:MAG: bifunctional 4-hydroxy-3-methylbut-2-enyl diphosphate reductase/30S ribosomal protein S1 [Saccharofermentanales bacterium]|jgi:small subunit ribosomal protein S1